MKRLVFAAFLLIGALSVAHAQLVVPARTSFADAPFTLSEVGDSLTTVVNGVQPYSTLILFSIQSNHAYSPQGITRGLGGDGWQYIYTCCQTINLVQDAAANLNPSLAGWKAGHAHNYLILFAGTNDIWLGSYNASQTYAYFQGMMTQQIAAGWAEADIFVIPCLPRETMSETTRSSYNASLQEATRPAGGNYAYHYVTLSSLISAAGQQNNETYFQGDNIHLTAYGQQILANDVYSAMITAGAFAW